jgi:hypothetical protein
MKIPLQQKIAELEQRIVALEALAKKERLFTRTSVRTDLDARSEGHWSRMWFHFDEMMHRIFR